MRDLRPLLSELSVRHDHLCPRQVLGVRLGLAGPGLLGFAAPRSDKAFLVIAETDGCFTDGLAVAAGVSVGHRTLRVADYGKIAATFVNAKTGAAIRLAPRLDVRQTAYAYAPGESRRYQAQLLGYQRMPDEELFSVRQVSLNSPVAQIVGRPGVRTCCAGCGEEIINRREMVVGGKPYCPACVGQGYYLPMPELPSLGAQIPVSKPDWAPRQNQVQWPALLVEYGKTSA
jgi:formylmethanofuran dehydrogenase subunit E